MVRTGDGVEMILGRQEGPDLRHGHHGRRGRDDGRALRGPGPRIPAAQRAAGPAACSSRLKIWPLLNGYRGRPAADVDGLIEALIRLSYLAADLPEVAELDINPLLVGPAGVLALDARIVVEAAPPAGTKPYAHLALRPYPEEFVRKIGVMGRRGGHAPARSSPRTSRSGWTCWLPARRRPIYSRFRYFFFWQSHEVATRFCYIDYDREMAIVAETGSGADRKLLGVGRLIADPDRHTAEYAVLVTGRLAGPGARRHPHGLLPRASPASGASGTSRPSRRPTIPG